MDNDQKLVSQLRSLGKKLSQFRDLVAKIEIPEALPEPPFDGMFWSGFVSRCSAAITVLRQVEAALTPDMYLLAVYPSEKIWRNPAAVPDLLGMPERSSNASTQPIACSREELDAWNRELEQANRMLLDLLESSNQPVHAKKRGSDTISPDIASAAIEDQNMISRLFSMTSQERASADLAKSTV